MATSKPTLWMGDLEPYMDENFIRGAFEYYGEKVVSVKLITNRYTGGPATYCFVEFDSMDVCQRTLLRLNGKPMPSGEPRKRFRLNKASYSKDNNPNSQQYSIYVGDLGQEVDDFTLFTAFNKSYPSTLGAKVVLNDDGSTRGFGFVRFSNSSEQIRALAEMNRQVIGKSSIRVSQAVPRKEGKKGPETNQQSNYDWSSYYNQQQWGQQWQDYYGMSASGGYTESQSRDGDEALVEPSLQDDKTAVNDAFLRKFKDTYTAIDQARWVRPAMLKAAEAAGISN